MQDITRISVVLPSLDPDEKLAHVIDGLLQYGFTDIILVNDGSKPENVHYFTDAEAAHPEVTLLTHPVNRGKGAAMKTAFNWLLENRKDCLGAVTVDGDDQHHPEDTLACCRNMLKTGHITLGCRDFSQSDVPPRSRFGNRCTSLVFRLFCGIRLSDTQTGLRAFPADTLRFLTRVEGERYEYETNMLLEMKKEGLPFDEVKIRTVYIEENKSSHFHVLRDSWRIYRLILAYFFRYSLSSITCFFIDSGLVFLLNILLHGVLSGLTLTMVRDVLARLVSSLINFFMNKHLVFHSEADTGRAMLRYYCLAVPQALAQILLDQTFCQLLGIRDDQSGLRTLIHILAMAVLFLLSYSIQQRWVFASKNKKDSRGNKV